MIIEFIQTHPAAQLPSRAHETDTGLDLYCVEDTAILAKSSAVVPVGLQVGYIEPGFWFSIQPRSGLGFKHNLQPHLGVIDNGYRGSLDVLLYNFSMKDYVFKVGDRVAQLVFYPLILPQPHWTNQTTDTSRGEKGFGSSGK
jgi:dUTP pyrophosphatase